VLLLRAKWRNNLREAALHKHTLILTIFQVIGFSTTEKQLCDMIWS